ncbi:MAG TPA: nucleotide exchange factor GrpE [Nitrosopumilus sp.]|nr:nucleotide exchange factor GrpE [Nitrosopumilus sp.]
MEVNSEEESEEKLNGLPLQKESEESEEEPELSLEELKKLLSQEKEKTMEYELKFKRALADLQNLDRKTKLDIESGINTKIDQFMIEFLQIYDDFVRAKEAFSKNNVNVEGLDSILKNMDSLLLKNNVSTIDALGEIFDPKLHEAISIMEDSTLEENTITKELRKGYISHNRVIRPTLVEISKKIKSEKLGE